MLTKATSWVEDSVAENSSATSFANLNAVVLSPAISQASNAIALSRKGDQKVAYEPFTAFVELLFSRSFSATSSLPASAYAAARRKSAC